MPKKKGTTKRKPAAKPKEKAEEEVVVEATPEPEPEAVDESDFREEGALMGPHLKGARHDSQWYRYGKGRKAKADAKTA